MTGDPSLTDEQLAALEPHVRLVEAGPGAGKTKTVVARLRQQTDSGRAVALLSFTNAAVDVARSRFRDTPALMEPPNFIGTFDQFFHRYVLTPATHRLVGKSPTYLSSWDELPKHLSIVRPPKAKGGTGIRLSQFTLRAKLTWEVDHDRLNRTEEQTWRKLSDWSRNEVNRTGSARINRLHSSDIFDTSEARRRALKVLQEPGGEQLERLARRFGEIIVDEFQDCDEVEHLLLDLLHTSGIHVVGVADPDQAIYEFRQNNAAIYERFRGRLNPTEVAALTTCFRSTPVICSLVSSLRTVGLSGLAANPGHIGGADTIHVVVGSKDKAGSKAFEIIREYGISSADTRVVAHRKSDARVLIQTGKEPPRGSSNMEAFLVSLDILLSGADPRGRLAAVRRVESFVLDQFAWPDDLRLAAKEYRLEALGVTPDQLRGLVSTLLSTSDEWDSAKGCSSSVRETLEKFAAETHVGLEPKIGGRLRVMEKVWDFWVSREVGRLGSTDMPRWGHVHGVKGDEFDAVILAIPTRSPGPTHVLDDWQNGDNTEQRRVFYVGASRARRLLVLVVPSAKKSQLETILSNAGISYTLSAST